MIEHNPASRDPVRMNRFHSYRQFIVYLSSSYYLDPQQETQHPPCASQFFEAPHCIIIYYFICFLRGISLSVRRDCRKKKRRRVPKDYVQIIWSERKQLSLKPKRSRDKRKLIRIHQHFLSFLLFVFSVPGKRSRDVSSEGKHCWMEGERKRRRRKRKRKKKQRDANDAPPHSSPPNKKRAMSINPFASEVTQMNRIIAEDDPLHKYWSQRYRLWSRFDEGIQMDDGMHHCYHDRSLPKIIHNNRRMVFRDPRGNCVSHCTEGARCRTPASGRRLLWVLNIFVFACCVRVCVSVLCACVVRVL